MLKYILVSFILKVFLILIYLQEFYPQLFLLFIENHFALGIFSKSYFKKN